MVPADNDVASSSGGPSVGPTFGDELWDTIPIGLAVVSGTGRLRRLNRTGRAILGVSETSVEDLVGPFDVGDAASGGQNELRPECVAGWNAALGVHRELAYRIDRVGNDYVVAFRDVTVRRQQERRAAAVARTAARVASERSLTTTLDAMAREVLQTDGLAGVQILAADDASEDLRVMGSAGFSHSEDFFALLMKCREHGASLKMLDAFTTGQHVVVHNRYDTIMTDPSWKPLHGYLRHPRWDSFASVPLLVRGRSVGVLNVFFSPGQIVGLADMDFLTTMAEQAAMAIDYAALLERERLTVRRAERQRLARELHDSVVQQVFSIGMQTQVLKVIADRGLDVGASSVTTVVTELETLSQSALRDLRSLVNQLRPPSATDKGLAHALRILAGNTQRRTDIAVSLRLPATVDALDIELTEDVYFIIAEAVHNAVKHSGADRIDIELRECKDTSFELEVIVRDDGCGPTGFPRNDTHRHRTEGYGLISMRDRTESWHGTLSIEPGPESQGTVIRARIPVPTPEEKP